MPEDDMKSVDADQAIKRFSLAAVGVGLVPIPWADLMLLAGLQLGLVRRLAVIYDVEVVDQAGKSAIAALLAGGFPVSLSANLTSLAKGVPWMGWLVGGGSLALLGAASTYAVGKVFVQHFESGNTMLTFDPEKVRAYYQKQLEEGKAEIVKTYAGIKP